MSIYYYAVDEFHKKYFSAPSGYALESPGIYHPENPFSHMIVMMNCRGYYFEVWNDCSLNVPPEDDYEEITETVYQQYLNEFKEFFQPERSKREDVLVFRPEKYEGPIDIDAIPSKECREYHENSGVQIGNKTMRCSEHGGNIVREVQ